MVCFLQWNENRFLLEYTYVGGFCQWPSCISHAVSWIIQESSGKGLAGSNLVSYHRNILRRIDEGDHVKRV